MHTTSLTGRSSLAACARLAALGLLIFLAGPLRAECPVPGFALDVATLSRVIAHPVEPDTVFAIQHPGVGSEPALLKSCDAGASWSATALTHDFYSIVDLAVSPLDAERVYATTSLGELVSTDGGITWSETEFPGAYLAFAADGTLYSHDADRIYRRSPGRDDWEALTPVPTSFDVLRLHPLDPARLHVGQYYTVDAGASWQRVLPGRVRDLRYSHGNPDFMIATGDGGPAVLSNDGGVNWSALPLAEFEFFASADFDGWRVAVDARDDDVLWIATRRCGLYRSEDRGVRWRIVADGLTGTGENCQFGAGLPQVREFVTSGPDPDRLYAITSDGLFTFDGDTATWIDANGTPDPGRGTPPPHPYSGSADLALSLSGLPGSYTPPVTFRFSGTVRNLGPDTARDVYVNINADVLRSSHGNCVGIDCDLGDLPAGAVVHIDFERSLSSGGHGANCTGDVFSLAGRVIAATDDPNPANNAAEISSTRQNNASLISRCEGEGLLQPEGGGGSFSWPGFAVLIALSALRRRPPRRSSGSRSLPSSH